MKTCSKLLELLTVLVKKQFHWGEKKSLSRSTTFRINKPARASICTI